MLKEIKLVMQPLLIISQMGPEINLPKLRQSEWVVKCLVKMKKLLKTYH